MGLFQPLFIGPESGKLRDSKVNEIWDQIHKHSHYGKTSGGGSTESQYLSKSRNTRINIYFSKSRSNTMTTILK